MEITKIETVDMSKINDVVTIHLNTFPGFFLTFMGRGFLNQMYRSYVEYSESGILLAVENKKIIGFLAYSGDLSGLYKYMISKRLIQFAWYSMGAFFRKPSVFMRLVRAFLKPSDSKRNEKYVELASIGVDPSCKSKGVGSQLIDALKENADFDRYAYITLETDADNNVAANSFYRKNGFIVYREYTTPEGRKMLEYRWSR